MKKLTMDTVYETHRWGPKEVEEMWLLKLLDWCCFEGKFRGSETGGEMIPFEYIQWLKALDRQDADNASIPAAGEIVVKPCHEKPEGMSGYRRVCQKCSMVQPEECHVNAPCRRCGCPVILWIPGGQGRSE